MFVGEVGYFYCFGGGEVGGWVVVDLYYCDYFYCIMWFVFDVIDVGFGYG